MNYLERPKAKKEKDKSSTVKKERDSGAKGRLSTKQKLIRDVEKKNILRVKDHPTLLYKVTAYIDGIEKVPCFIESISEEAIAISAKDKSTKSGITIIPMLDVVSYSGGVNKESSVTCKARVVQDVVIGNVSMSGKFVNVKTDEKITISFNTETVKLNIQSVK